MNVRFTSPRGDPCTDFTFEPDVPWSVVRREFENLRQSVFFLIQYELGLSPDIQSDVRSLQVKYGQVFELEAYRRLSREVEQRYDVVLEERANEDFGPSDFTLRLLFPPRRPEVVWTRADDIEAFLEREMGRFQWQRL